MKTVGMISRSDAAIKNFAALTIGFDDPTGTAISLWMGPPDENGTTALEGRKRKANSADIEEIVDAIIGRGSLSKAAEGALDDAISEVDMSGSPLEALRLVLPIKTPEWEKLEEIFDIKPEKVWRKIEIEKIRTLAAAIRSEFVELTKTVSDGAQVDLNRVRLIVGAGLPRDRGWQVSVRRAFVVPHRPDPVEIAKCATGWQFRAAATWGMPPQTIAAAMLDSLDPGHPVVADYVKMTLTDHDNTWADRGREGTGRSMDRHVFRIVDGVIDLSWPAEAKSIMVGKSPIAAAEPEVDSEILDLIDA